MGLVAAGSPVEGRSKQDYAVLFVIGLAVESRVSTGRETLLTIIYKQAKCHIIGRSG